MTTSNLLLPCPFCGAEPAPFWNGVGCVTAKCAMDGLHISIEAWNRRATQPAAGEPVYQWRVPDGERWWTTSKSDYEWILENHPNCQNRILWTVPPAAAHGDEAVRKDAERYRWLRNQEAEHGVSVLNVGSWPLPATCIALTYPDAEAVDAAIDAAMRAQGDGGCAHE